MQNCKWKTKWVTLGLAVVALASSLAPSKAQVEENFAWITNTNGVTWKKSIDDFGILTFPQLSFGDSENSTRLQEEIAEIIVPEHAIIGYISAWDCVNLTNIILYPARPKNSFIFEPAPATIKNLGGVPLIISAGGSGLLNITCHKTMKDRIILWGDALFHEGEWAILQRPVRWTELPKMEIRTHATANGKELEVIWREGNLQIADAVNGKWRDHIGASPLRFPLVFNSKAQQFFRIRIGDD